MDSFVFMNREVNINKVKGPDRSDSVIILLSDQNDVAGIKKHILFPCYLLTISNIVWDSDLSPYAYEDDRFSFKGNLPAFINYIRLLLTSEEFPFKTNKVYIAGYSLAGLSALLIQQELSLSGAASCSGSIWYPGILEKLSKTEPYGRIYLSLGKKEKLTKNKLMSSIENDTASLYHAWSGKTKITYVLENGNHFYEPENRLSRGINWLLTEE